MRITNFAAYQEAYKQSVENPEQFWAKIASENFTWHKPFTKVLDWDFNDYQVKWFEDGQLNITTNALDRHAANQPNTVALIYEPNEPGDDAISITYKELLERVSRFANVLKANGVQKGDRVCIYMPMIP
ncbi:MAG: hypothetical protein RJA76_1243, partial [Bacteroidota bacterium]